MNVRFEEVCNEMLNAGSQIEIGLRLVRYFLGVCTNHFQNKQC